MKQKDSLEPIDSIREYCRLANITLADRVRESTFLSQMNAMTGLASETGEINEIFKKIYFHDHPFDNAAKEHIKKELGDLIWYWALTCFTLDFDPAEVLAVNIDKLAKRYPQGFSAERSMNRAPGDI